MLTPVGWRIRYSRVLDKYAERLANVRSIYRNSEPKDFDTILINAYNEVFLARSDLAAGNIGSNRRACVRRAVRAVGEYLKMSREGVL